MKEIKPFHILVFLLSVITLLGGIAFVFPENGIDLFGKKFSFPALASYFNSTKPEKKDISEILALADAEDQLSEEKDSTGKSEAKADSAAKKEIQYLEIKDPSIKLITSIQYRDSSRTALDNFFEALALLQLDEK